MKTKTKTTSFVVAILSLVLFSGLTVFIFREMRDRAALVSSNENERILTMLLTSLRDHEDFGSAIESDSVLKDRVIGIAVYGKNGESVYAWGKAQEKYADSDLEKYVSMNPGRYTVPDKEGGSLKFIMRTSKMGPPPPHHREKYEAQEDPEKNQIKKKYPFFFYIFENGEWLYLEIRHPDYWRDQNLMDFLFPLCEVFLAFLVFYIRNLVIRNDEYRERIEAQKSLVVLGTAASTLAHEIKNPLLAIRLQTSILGKLYGGKGEGELEIINSEIDRLSMLTYRVNDYLREPKGVPVPLPVHRALREIGQRMCGSDIVVCGAEKDFYVLMDRDRFRSVFENIVRNAIESGSPVNCIEAVCSRKDGMGEIEVLDRGNGIGELDRTRVFEPFFTTKSSGTGIGLTICQRFVQAAGGSIVLSSREGGGTSVLVRLPECRDEPDEKAD